MITSRRRRKTGNTVLMFDYHPDFIVYQAQIELSINGKSLRIPFKCTGFDGQRFMKDIELDGLTDSITISYILTTSLTGTVVKVKDTNTNLKIISETDDSLTVNPVKESGSNKPLRKSKCTRKKAKMSSEEEERLVKEYEQIILNNPELMKALDFLAQGSSENEEIYSDNSDDLDPLNLAKQIDDNASDEEITEKLFNLIFNDKPEEDKISECFDKIEELASNCISDTPNIERHFEKLKQYIFKNTNLISKMTSENRDYIRKVIRSIKSLMKTCKNISNKKTRSNALHEFSAKTELGDDTQTIQKFAEKYGIRSLHVESSSKSENNSENSNYPETFEISSNSKEVERVSNNSNYIEISANSENHLNNSKDGQNFSNILNFIKSSENLSENITGFT